MVSMNRLNIANSIVEGNTLAPGGSYPDVYVVSGTPSLTISAAI